MTLIGPQGHQQWCSLGYFDILWVCDNGMVITTIVMYGPEFHSLFVSCT